MSRRGMDSDDDGFGGGGVAFVGHAVDGDEHVGFGEIGGDAGAGNGVGYHCKLFGFSRVTLVMADKVYEMPFC